MQAVHSHDKRTTRRASRCLARRGCNIERCDELECGARSTCANFNGTCLALYRPMMKHAIGLAAVVALAACSVSPDQESAIGKQNADEINSQVPLVTDRDI